MSDGQAWLFAGLAGMGVGLLYGIYHELQRIRGFLADLLIHLKHPGGLD